MLVVPIQTIVSDYILIQEEGSDSFVLRKMQNDEKNNIVFLVSLQHFIPEEIDSSNSFLNNSITLQLLILPLNRLNLELPHSDFTQ